MVPWAEIIVFGLLSWCVVFFTLGTVGGLGGGFGTVDAFLEFGFEGFLEKLSSFDEKKRVHVIEGLTKGGIVGDEVAFSKQGFKFGEQQVANTGRIWLHRVEGTCKNLVGKRMKQTGACWRLPNANRMATLCAVLYSDQWKDC